MSVLSFIKKIRTKMIQLFQGKEAENSDKIHLNLDGLEIFLQRYFSYDIPHEVTIVVPRAELRKKIKHGNIIEETEIILNSITVVHSPQRPSNDEGGPPPISPKIPLRIKKN